jgi:ABC-type transport system substrate-binding protein|tara:strand:- start:791 stop:1078 length:288 start_codon:yes stop_codon:yes gene_type:complete
MELIWNSANDVKGGWAWTGFVDAELDEATSQIMKIGDFDKRCELAHTAQKIVMDNALMLPTLSQPVFYATSDKVIDFEISSEANYHFIHNTYILD